MESMWVFELDGREKERESKSAQDSQSFLPLDFCGQTLLLIFLSHTPQLRLGALYFLKSSNFL